MHRLLSLNFLNGARIGRFALTRRALRYARDMILTETISFLRFPRMWRPLNFLIFKIKMLVTYETKAADNFKHHIWNQHIFLVNTLEFEENQRTLLMSRPSIHPSIRPSATKVFFIFLQISVPKLKLHFQFTSDE